MFEICSDLSKKALKHTIFVNIKKGQKMVKWLKHFISGKQFQKGQICQIWLFKRPNGNPANSFHY